MNIVRCACYTPEGIFIPNHACEKHDPRFQIQPASSNSPFDESSNQLFEELVAQP